MSSNLLVQPKDALRILAFRSSAFSFIFSQRRFVTEEPEKTCSKEEVHKK
jgi:hypothetical protein